MLHSRRAVNCPAFINVRLAWLFARRNIFLTSRKVQPTLAGLPRSGLIRFCERCGGVVYFFLRFSQTWGVLTTHELYLGFHLQHFLKKNKYWFVKLAWRPLVKTLSSVDFVYTAGGFLVWVTANLAVGQLLAWEIPRANVKVPSRWKVCWVFFKAIVARSARNYLCSMKTILFDSTVTSTGRYARSLKTIWVTTPSALPFSATVGCRVIN